MYESALRDGLTKAFNKKYFTDRLESEFTFSTRHASPLALVLFDIDHFKKVNDTHGHQAGDHVLAEISTLLTGALRAEDVFARYGGEEFAVICRGSDTGQAQVVGERLRKAVEGHRFVYEGTHIPVTISVGVAVLPEPGRQGRQRHRRVRRPGALQIEARRPQPRDASTRPTSRVDCRRAHGSARKESASRRQSYFAGRVNGSYSLGGPCRFASAFFP